jgi:hypothetical protein
MMAQSPAQYPAQLSVDYPDRQLDRLSSALRILYVIPIGIVAAGITNSVNGILFLPVLLLILFRQKYPRWWYDWHLNMTRFSTRIGAYALLLRDEYPSTDDEQAVHLEIRYPDVEADLNRYLPIVKWALAIPHYVVLAFLLIGVVVAWVIAWFSILFTGRYPRGIFDYMVGVQRWSLRVQAYAWLMTTDKYPPFSLNG